LPKLLKCVEFGYEFNQLVEELPQSLESIKFDIEFN
jgi:hypothetical protein